MRVVAIILVALIAQAQQAKPTKPPAQQGQGQAQYKPSGPAQPSKPSATVPLPPPANWNEKAGPNTYDEYLERESKQEGFSPEQEADSLKLMKEVYPKEKAIATDKSFSYADKVKMLTAMNATTDAQMRRLMPRTMFLEWQAHNTLLESSYLAGIEPITPKTIKTSEWAAHPAPKTKTATPK